MQSSFNGICRVLLSDRPLSGYINVPDLFSLFPANEFSAITDVVSTPWLNRRMNKSGPNAKFGPPYPIVIQVPDSGDIDITFKRLDTYTYLVCLLFHKFRPFPRTNQDGEWISEWNAELQRMEHRIAQSGFGFREDTNLENYICSGGTEAAVFDGENYFDSIPYPKEVSVPEFLEQFFHNYGNLSRKKKANFDRASFLFWQAEQIWAFGGDPNPTYVSAVECLTEKLKVESCSACGARNAKLSEGYKLFLSNFALSSAPVMEQQKKMYTTRSKSVHGARTLQIDGDNFGSDEQFTNDILFPWLTRKALVNWLLAETNH